MIQSMEPINYPYLSGILISVIENLDLKYYQFFEDDEKRKEFRDLMREEVIKAKEREREYSCKTLK